MPFLPFVLLLAWQALSKSASFALGWATALYFGQVPGSQGRILAVVSLVAAGWVIVIIGFAIPIFTGALLEAAGVIERNFDVEAIHYLALVGAIVLAPPAVAGGLVIGEFRDERTVSEWLRLIPVSYPATFLLGLAVLEMVAFTPFLLVQRWRQKRTLVQVPLVMKEGTDDDDLVEAVRAALASIGIEDVSVTEATGPKAWPMRTVGFAARHLLGAVVRGDPMRLKADGLEIFAYATNVAVLGPTEDAHRVRAAVERELAFRDAYLTWSDDSQQIEDELTEARKSANGDFDGLRRKLDEVQERMDSASLNSEEWNVLYRLRLQVEQAAARRRDDPDHH
ncbi:MAG TPA: hypothetical protein VJ850_06465 [Candidatus Limnocylindrales bacterium]|nr:hypothetical protein [Candidatus Limnocylindrales bacterium]